LLTVETVGTELLTWAKAAQLKIRKAAADKATVLNLDMRTNLH